jgi:NADP-reducing hydrogenase subunit HndD
MPCTAKKYEIGREDQKASGYPDIDATITTRELGRMIDRAGIIFNELPDEEFDPAFGVSTGASVIFGATGGVMEAALRTVAEIVTGKELEKLEFCDVRGVAGVKEAQYDLNGKIVRVAVASCLSNAKRLLDSIKSGEKLYDFVEIMACPGGCVNGGGQPIQPSSVTNFNDLRAMRAKAIYCQDVNMPLRKSHKNPLITKLYSDYLEKPGSHKAHKILHTAYHARPRYKV